MRSKSVSDYEQESYWDGACLIHPATRPEDGNRLSRKLYQLRHGLIKSSKIFVCHTCDNPKCILDEHHFLGTQKENMQDAARKGRLRQSPEALDKFRTKRIGHVVTEETRQKISDTKRATHRHRPITEETRQKISLANHGRPYTGSLTHEQRSVAGLKGWETRRGRK
jgi:hypothetical protein